MFWSKFYIFGHHKLVLTLRSGKVWQIWRFANVSSNFATAISKFDTFSLYHILRTPIAKVTASFSLFSLSELVIHYSLLIYPELILLWSVPDRQTEKILHPLFLSSFFSMSAWCPTCRRNFTGLAELWGGWPIELEIKLNTPCLHTHGINILLRICCTYLNFCRGICAMPVALGSMMKGGCYMAQ